MKKQQTAVEWLKQRLQSEPFLTVEDVNTAKQIERTQIVNAWNKGYQISYIDTEAYRKNRNFSNKSAEHYYNETY